jgi:hypothetical protein
MRPIGQRDRGGADGKMGYLGYSATEELVWGKFASPKGFKGREAKLTGKDVLI